MAPAKKGAKKRKAEAAVVATSGEVLREEKKQRTGATKERQNQLIIAALKKDGSEEWKTLTPSNKWKKDNVLAVFQSDKIPREMQEERWSQYAPESIRNDRGIFLAGLARKVFPDYYHNLVLTRGEPTYFEIPDTLLSDKDVVAAAVSQCPKVLTQLVDRKLLDDSDIFRAYLTSMWSDIPKFWRLVRRFSDRIRGDAELMLEAAEACSKPTALFKCFSSNLMNDSSFAVQFAERAHKIPNDALGRFSYRVRCDSAVVLAFVQRNGLCLKDASEAKRCKYKIVRAACKNRPEALLHCAHGPTRRRLCGSKSFMLNLFSRLNWEHPDGYNELYCMLSPALKCDFDLVLAANGGNSLLISDVPLVLRRDSKFWMYIVARDVRFWEKLPVEFRNNPDFFRAIKDFKSHRFALRTLEAFACLASDRDVWTNIIDSKLDEDESFEDGPLVDLLLHHAPMQIREDEELMLRACRNQPSVLKILSDRFQEIREFVEAAVEDPDNAVCLISHAAQCLYPDLIAKAIRNSDFYDLRDFLYEGKLAEANWTNLEVAKAWFDAGGKFHHFFPETLKDDKAFGLVVADHGGIDEFELGVSETLRGDKAFMMQAVVKNSCCFVFACGGLDRDFDLAIMALASPYAGDLIDRVIDEEEEKGKRGWPRFFTHVYRTVEKGWNPTTDLSRDSFAACLGTPERNACWLCLIKDRKQFLPSRR